MDDKERVIAKIHAALEQADLRTLRIIFQFVINIIEGNN